MTDAPELPIFKLEGATAAPVIVFDGVPLYGTVSGMVRLVLEAIVQTESEDGRPTQRRVVVAHLRCGPLGLQSLRSALDGIDLMLTGPARPEGPTN